MQPIDHSEFEASGPSSFEHRLKAMYGDGPKGIKPLNLKLVLSFIGIGALSFWGGVVWLGLRMLAHHA